MRPFAGEHYEDIAENAIAFGLHPPDGRAGEDDRFRIDKPLQRRRLATAPDGIGLPTTFGKSLG